MIQGLRAVSVALLSIICLTSVPALAAPRTLTDATGASVTIDDTARIVSVGGGVTETVFALDAGDRVVGVDTSSVYPEAATKLPQVGYQRTLSAEGVMSLKPSLILVTVEAGPPPVIEQLRGTKVPLLVLPADNTPAGAKERIRIIARALGADAKGEEVVAALTADLSTAAARVASLKSQPGVLFLYARGPTMLNVSGSGTAAAEMITLAGGRNAVSGYEGFKPLTPEAAVAAKPDVILTLSRGLDSIGGVEGVFALPGMSLTPAAKDRRVVAMDDLYLLGFGPRTGKAVLDLAAQLHPELADDAPAKRSAVEPATSSAGGKAALAAEQGNR